ncbi:hypothetical protein DEV91_10481 [Phyllobacterium brassicacearum]|nr:hypothetical protein DEV91_10481 [Phyllobacterium brassicacearum]
MMLPRMCDTSPKGGGGAGQACVAKVSGRRDSQQAQMTALCAHKRPRVLPLDSTDNVDKAPKLHHPLNAMVCHLRYATDSLTLLMSLNKCVSGS